MQPALPPQQQAPALHYNQPGIYIRRPQVRVYSNYRHNQSNGLGFIHILVGILCILFNAVSLGFNDSVGVVSHGVWNGLLFIITGSFAIAAAKSRTKCLIITFMVMSIISAIMTTSLLTLAIIGTSVDSSAGYYTQCSGNYGYAYYEASCYKIAFAMETCLAILAIVEAIVSIWGSAICCRSVCCCAGTREDEFLPHFYFPNQMDQMQMQMMMQYQQMQMNGGQQLQQPPPPPMMMQHCANWSAFNQGYSGSQGHLWNPYMSSTVVSPVNASDPSPPPYEASPPFAPGVIPETSAIPQQLPPTDSETEKY